MVTARADVAWSTYMPRSHSSAAVGFPRSRLLSHSSANEHLRSCFHFAVEVPKEILIIILLCFARAHGALQRRRRAALAVGQHPRGVWAAGTDQTAGAQTSSNSSVFLPLLLPARTRGDGGRQLRPWHLSRKPGGGGLSCISQLIASELAEPNTACAAVNVSSLTPLCSSIASYNCIHL